MRVLFLSTTDPDSFLTWSGITKAIYRQFKQHYAVVDSLVLGQPIASYERWLGYATKRLSGMKTTPFHTPEIARYYASRIEPVLRSSSYDLIVAPAGAFLVSGLKTDIPILLISDTTYDLMVGYYESHSNLTKRSVRLGHQIESSALQRSSILNYSSEWASNSARVDYNVDPNKVITTHFGSNLADIPERDVVLKSIESKRKDEVLNLFFLGVDWIRKGGPLVADTVRELRSRSVKVQLQIVGCVPPDSLSDIQPHVIPYLNKNDPDQRKQLIELFMKQHVFFVPSIAECYGIVYAEAASLGIPSVSRNTGGISNAIIQGHSGTVLSETSNAMHYADQIESLWKDRDRYHALATSSRMMYEERLNWTTWMTQIHAKIQEIR